MEKILLLKIFQPFAQYRNPFTFYYAQTYPLPPKTVIIGMLQNATNRFYDEEFWNLKVSVYGGFESIFWNYQQLLKGDFYWVDKKEKILFWNRQKIKKKTVERLVYNENGIICQRSPVYQQELFNGHLYVFLKGEKQLLNDIKHSLSNPLKILYLGRSEDVIFIKRIFDTSDIKLEEQSTRSKFFRTSLPTYIKRDGFPITREKFPVYSIGTKVVFKNNGKPVRNKAEISHFTERESEFTAVIYTGTGYVIPLRENIKLGAYRIKSGGREIVFKIPEEFGWL